MALGYSSCLIILLLYLTSGYSEYHEKKGLSILLVHSMFPSHIYPLLSLGAELASRGHTVSCIGSVVEGFDHIPALAESYSIKYKHISYMSRELYDGFKETGKHDGDKSWVTLMANLTSFILKTMKAASPGASLPAMISTGPARPVVLLLQVPAPAAPARARSSSTTCT